MRQSSCSRAHCAVSLKFSYPSRWYWSYESVLMRPEHLHYASASASQIEGLIISLLSVAVKRELHDYFGPYSVDPNDNHILSLATHGRADAIVLHNTRHFATPAKASGVNLYTAREALHLLRR